MSQIYGIVKILSENFTYLGLILALVGLISAFKLNRKIFYYSLFMIVLIGFVFPLNSGILIYQLNEIHILERFQIITSVFVGLLLGFGILKVKKMLLSKKQPRTKKLGLLFLGAIPLVILGLNFNQVNQKDNYFGEYLAEDFLSTIPPNSILITEGDAVINSLFYYQYALGKRNDVACILSSLLLSRTPWYLDEIKFYYPDIILPDANFNPQQYLIHFLELNSGHKNIFFYTPSLFKEEFSLLLPKKAKGLVWQYIQAGENIESNEEIEAQLINAYKNYKNLVRTKRFPMNWPEATFLNIYADPYLYLAEINKQDFKKAEQYYQEALKIAPDYFWARYLLGEFYLAHNQLGKAIETWEEYCHNNPDRDRVLETRKEINKLKHFLPNYRSLFDLKNLLEDYSTSSAGNCCSDNEGQ